MGMNGQENINFNIDSIDKNNDKQFDINDIKELLKTQEDINLLKDFFANIPEELTKDLVDSLKDSISSKINKESVSDIYALQIIANLSGKKIELDGKWSKQIEDFYNKLGINNSDGERINEGEGETILDTLTGLSNNVNELFTKEGNIIDLPNNKKVLFIDYSKSNFALKSISSKREFANSKGVDYIIIRKNLRYGKEQISIFDRKDGSSMSSYGQVEKYRIKKDNEKFDSNKLEEIQKQNTLEGYKILISKIIKINYL